MSRIVDALRKWQDYAWIVVLLFLAYLAYSIIPAIDPRSGIDGWGDLFAALVLAVKGVMATVLAWLCKNLYWWEPGSNEEARWHAAIEATTEPEGDPLLSIGRAQLLTAQRAALILVIKDRIEWLAWLCFWSWVLFTQ